jgi:hypothetical protein
LPRELGPKAAPATSEIGGRIVRLIREYACQWNPGTHTGQVSLQTEDEEIVHLPMTSLADIAGLLMILQERPVGILSDGTISTHWEGVGEHDTTL